MPFMLYAQEGGQFRFTGQHLRLAGKNGPLFNKFRDLPPDDVRYSGWHLSELQILKSLRVPSPENHRFVVDLKPAAQDQVSFYRLHDVWGWRSTNWCPLALRLTALYSDHPVEDVAAFKQSFPAPVHEGVPIHEFLYLQGSRGRWTWGRTGGVNGPLLWPEPMEFFFTEISKGMGWQLPDGDRR